MAGNPFAPPSGGSKSTGPGDGSANAKLGAIARRIAGKGKASGPGQPSVNQKSMPAGQPNLTINPGMFGNK